MKQILNQPPSKIDFFLPPNNFLTSIYHPRHVAFCYPIAIAAHQLNCTEFNWTTWTRLQWIKLHCMSKASKCTHQLHCKFSLAGCSIRHDWLLGLCFSALTCKPPPSSLLHISAIANPVWHMVFHEFQYEQPEISGLHPKHYNVPSSNILVQKVFQIPKDFRGSAWFQS